MPDVLNIDDYRARIRCGSCGHELAEVSQDGNELRTIVGTTHHPFELRCPWCHTKRKWIPARLSKKSG